MSETFFKGANDEQLVAIKSHGSVILNAGAGSGKTYVIVSHLIFKIQEMAKSIIESKQDLKMALPEKLERMVIMTFTKKAAGELVLRVHKRIDGLIEEFPEDPLWKLVKDHFHRLYIGTIHGFCYRLIKSGLLPQVSTDAEIIDQFTLESKIQKLIENYLDQTEGKDTIHAILNRSSEGIISSMGKVFSDPDLKNTWKSLAIQNNRDHAIGKYFTDLKEIAPFYELWDSSYSEYEFEIDGKSPKWKVAVNKAVACLQRSTYSLAGFSELNANIEKNISKPKVEDEKLLALIEALNNFKKYAKDQLENLEIFYQHFDKFLEWNNVLQEIYHNLEDHYKEAKVMTFGDMELAVSDALMDKDVLKSVQSKFDYFVVDEFQDTSWLQYLLLRNVIGEDFNKLFCVGDMKQAIYGFRGGEIGVFKDCSVKVSSPLNMKANYRSRPNIVEFNNLVFEQILPMGIEYDGRDRHVIEVVPQIAQESQDGNGELIRLKLDIPEADKKPSPKLINAFEAKELAQYLDDHRNDGLASCILYRKLGPSHLLIAELMERGLGFKCQVKIPFGQDPIIIIFHSLLEAILLFENEHKSSLAYLNFIIPNILNLLKIQMPANLEEYSKRFLSRIPYYGLRTSYELFLADINVGLLDNRDSINFINSLCHEHSLNYELIWSQIKSRMDRNFSFEFRYGENSDNIVIMTAHASKGLQFPRVLIGGIHTNGGDKADREFIGKLPGTLKWTPFYNKKKLYTSPLKWSEDQAEKLKNFSESKRLFYVACTRAVSTLVWVDLEYKSEPLSHSQNSWIVGLRKTYPNIRDLVTTIDCSLPVSKIENDEEEESFDNVSSDNDEVGDALPLFHLDRCGLVEYSPRRPEIKILSELSVTRLSTVSQCPRKFYLQNICKLDANFFDPKKFDENYIYKETAEDLQIVDEFKVNINETAMERGSRLHAELSKMVTDQDFEIDQATQDSQPILNWIKSLIDHFSEEIQLHSEIAVKFDINGFMISGTADLVLVDETNQKIEIWDFKTGKRKKDSEENYLTQVLLYGFHYLKKFQFPEITMKLLYLDEKKIVEQTMSKQQVVDQVNQLWSLVDQPHQINIKHCSQCSFGNLCRTDTHSVDRHT